MTSEVDLLLVENRGLEIKRKRSLNGRHRDHTSSESGAISSSASGSGPEKVERLGDGGGEAERGGSRVGFGDGGRGRGRWSDEGWRERGSSSRHYVFDLEEERVRAK